MKPMMHNIDANTVVEPFLNAVAAKENPVREDLYPFVDQYAGTGITDILFNIFCQYSFVDSRVWSDYAYKYGQTEENGIAVDYRDRNRSIYRLKQELGLDPHQIWIDRTRELGMNPWISIRMNDCHCPDEEVAFLRSEFFYEAREKGWMIGSHYGYFRWCFDYAVPEVRQKMLDYLREQLARYDVYGVELDFQREIYCFDYINNPNCHEIMTQFMRDARQIVKVAGESWGHPIQIGVRLGRDLEQNKIFGFDAVTWAKERLIDLVVPTPRWNTNDDEMPIAHWVESLPGVAVRAGLEILVKRQTNNAAITAEVARSLTAKYLNQGSDGIYMFNLFIGHGNSETINEQFREIYRTCCSLEQALALPQRYVVMWQDTYPEGCAPSWPLPIPLTSEGGSLDIDLGILPQVCDCTLTLGVEGKLHQLTVNGTAVSPMEAGVAGEKGFCQPGAKLLSCPVPPATKYSLRFSGSGEVVYASVYIQPK